MKRCDFEFICDKRWYDLTPTDRDDARHCSDCDQQVFRVDGDAEVEVARILRRCAAEVPDPALFGLVGGLNVRIGPFVAGFIPIAVRLVESVTESRVADMRLSFRALFDGGVNEARLLAGDLVLLGNLEQDALRLLGSELEQQAPELLLTGTDSASSVQVDRILGRTEGIIDPIDLDDPAA